MIRDLVALLQLPLLYFPAVVLGLGLYGSDFESGAGYVYLLPLPAVLLAGLVVDPLLPRLPRWGRVGLLLAGAAITGGILLLLRRTGWDERSLLQAGLVAALAVPSIGAALQGAGRLNGNRSPRRPELAAALALCGIPYLAVWLDPFLLWSGIGCALAYAASGVGTEPPAVRSTEPSPGSSSRIPPGSGGAILLWLFADSATVAWDFGPDPTWGPLVGLTLLAAAAGAIACGTRPWLLLGLLASLATAAWPALILSPLRTILLGLALGTALRAFLAAPSGELRPMRALHVAPLLAIGLVVSYQLAFQVQAYPAARLILPAIPAAVWSAGRARRRLPTLDATALLR